VDWAKERRGGRRWEKIEGQEKIEREEEGPGRVRGFGFCKSE
jgi:hypothetical protein